MSCGELGPIEGGLIKNSTIQNSTITGSEFTGGEVRSSDLNSCHLKNLASCDAPSARTIAGAIADDATAIRSIADGIADDDAAAGAVAAAVAVAVAGAAAGAGAVAVAVAVAAAVAVAVAGAVAVIHCQKDADLVGQRGGCYRFHTGTALILASAAAVVGMISMASVRVMESTAMVNLQELGFLTPSAAICRVSEAPSQYHSFLALRRVTSWPARDSRWPAKTPARSQRTTTYF